MSIATYIAELFAFALIVFVLWRYLVPPLRTVVTAQQRRVERQLDEARQARERLQEAERKYRDAIEEARHDAARIRDNARVEAQNILEDMKRQAQREAEAIRQRGEQELAAQRSGMVRQLTAELGASSLQHSEQQVRAAMADPAQRSASVDRFLDELDGMSGAAGKGER